MEIMTSWHPTSGLQISLLISFVTSSSNGLKNLSIEREHVLFNLSVVLHTATEALKLRNKICMNYFALVLLDQMSVILIKPTLFSCKIHTVILLILILHLPYFTHRK